MSRLKELIEQYCPDGVEYKALGEVGTLTKGKGLQKKDFTESGVGCIHYGQIYTRLSVKTTEVLTYVSEESAKKFTAVMPGDLVIAITSENVDDVCKSVVWMGDEPIVTGAHAAVFHHGLDPMYVGYLFQTYDINRQKVTMVDGVKVIEMKVEQLEKLRIPVPPIEVQREIVRILDAMQELDDALNEELIVRQVQLDYAIETMLSEERINRFEGETVEYSTVKDLRSQVITPVRAKPTDFSGDIPWCKLEDVEGFELRCSLSGKGVSDEVVKSMGLKVYPEGTVLCSCSATLGKYCIVERPLVTNQRFMGFVCKEGVYNRYFMYAVKAGTSALVREATGTTNPYISRSAFESLQIQLPSYAVQLMVSEKLDSVYRYISVLEEELQTRRKQFEYYRDKLLDFPEKVA